MDKTSSSAFPTYTGFPVIKNSIPALLLIGDIVSFVSCLQLGFGLNTRQPLNWLDPLIEVFALLLFVGLYLADAYKPDTQLSGLRTPARILICCVIVAVLSAFVIYLSGTWGTNPLAGRVTLLFSLGMFSILAMISRLWAVSWVRSHAEQSRWLMLGTGENAIQVSAILGKLNPLEQLFVLSEIGQDTTTTANDSWHCLGNLNHLATCSQESWSAVIISTQTEISDIYVQQLMQMRLRGIPVYRLPDFYEALWYRIPSSLLQDRWLAFSDGFNLMPGYLSIKLKQIIDIVLAGLLLIVLSPIMLLAALAIKLESRGPVFYSQLRTGQNGKLFRVYKFRSMSRDAEKRGIQWASKLDPRITKVGRWLRLMRIDELPQIWNILRGDMSLIGPRPERPEFDIKLKAEIPYYDLRYLIKPGISGWAQVMYPYGASVEDAYQKLSYDLYYIKNYSLWLDLAIAFKTLRVVLLGKGR